MNRVIVPATVVFKRVGEEAVALNLDSGQYYGLDEMATRFWELLTTAGTIEETQAALLGEFAVGEETLRNDVERFVDELVAAGLLERVEE